MSQDKLKFQSLSPNDVVSVSAHELIYPIWGTSTATVVELQKKIASVFGITKSDHLAYQWCVDGIESKVLIAEKGGGWKEGRVRFSVEFLPIESTQEDNLTSEAVKPSLDEFR
jgi:hypothetical protein